MNADSTNATFDPVVFLRDLAEYYSDGEADFFDLDPKDIAKKAGRAANEIERLRRQRDEAIAFVGRWFPDAFVADLKEIFNGE